MPFRVPGPINVRNPTGQVKGWIVFNGSGTASIYTSFNVTSLTDNGTGDFTVTWARAMQSTAYVAVGMCTQDTTVGGIVNIKNAVPFTTTAARIQCTNDQGNAFDPITCTIVAIGEMAGTH